VTLLGIQPDRPEVGYGWIAAGQELYSKLPLFRVKRFCEKPSYETATELWQQGCLWSAKWLHDISALLTAHEAAPAPVAQRQTA
jgi:mannose-1-phosphate guanylyltransferase